MARIYLHRYVLFILAWLVLTRGDIGHLFVGAVVSAAAAWGSLKLLPAGSRSVSLWRSIKEFPGFLHNSLRGGLDVAYRALHPRMPLNTGWVRFKTRLPAGLPRLTLASETTLLPGSLVAGSREDILFVHCLDKGQDIAGSLRIEEVRIARTLIETTSSNVSGTK